MAKIEYHLFRVKLVKPMQISLLEGGRTPEDYFREALQERPSIRLRGENAWHVGNLRQFTDSTGYFAFGRTTRRNVAMFDASSGDFLEEASEESPYTHVVFNAHLGTVAIARKSSLSPTVFGLASRLRKLLNAAKVITENDIQVRIDPISDPADFIKRVHTAYSVTAFAASFTGPNPFDADEYFQKPLSVYLRAAGGENGKATITGTDLDRDVVEAVSRSTASTGNDASAKIRENAAGPPLTIHMRGDTVRATYEEESHDVQKVLEDFDQRYLELRAIERD